MNLHDVGVPPASASPSRLCQRLARADACWTCILDPRGIADFSLSVEVDAVVVSSPFGLAQVAPCSPSWLGEPSVSDCLILQDLYS